MSHVQEKMITLKPPCTVPARRWYLSGEKATIELCVPGKRSLQLGLKISLRLVELYSPSLMNNIIHNAEASTRTLQITVGATRDPEAVEIPALHRIVNCITNLMHDNSEWDILPPTKTVEDHILLLRGCQLFHFREGAENAGTRIDKALDAGPLTPDDVRLLWYVYGDSERNLDDITKNIAKYDFDDAGLILHFLESELAHEQQLAFSERPTIWRQAISQDREEEDWRRRNHVKLKDKVKQQLLAVKQLVTQ